MTAEELSCKGLEDFNKFVDGLIEEELQNIEKGIPKKVKEVKIESTEAITTKTELGEKDMVKPVEEVEEKVVESKVTEVVTTESATHDKNGNPILIGSCRKFAVIITEEDGTEYHYGSAKVASDYLNVPPATVRNRCRKEEYVDDQGRLWEEMSREEYFNTYVNE